jgi:hypothetical protein
MMSEQRASMQGNAVRPLPAVVIVMGVSGSGKSTIGSLLAGRLQWEFEDGDWFHPPANVEKIHKGIPLTDEDRGPWLHSIAAWLDQGRHEADADYKCRCSSAGAAMSAIGDRTGYQSWSTSRKRGSCPHRTPPTAFHAAEACAASSRARGALAAKSDLLDRAAARRIAWRKFCRR